MMYTEATWPTKRWPNFSYREIACRTTGTCDMDPIFMDRLQSLRDRLGFGLTITSGYRAPSSPVEAQKPGGPGSHSMGLAVDIGVQGEKAYQVLKGALEMGFTGVGINQKGTGRYIHLDTATHVPRPAIWSY